MVQLNDFLTLQWCESDIDLVKIVLQNLNFDLFPGKQMRVNNGTLQYIHCIR